MVGRANVDKWGSKESVHFKIHRWVGAVLSASCSLTDWGSNSPSEFQFKSEISQQETAPDGPLLDLQR